MADANDPSVLVEIQVPDPAADMASQIDPAFVHARDGASVGGTACHLLAYAGTFDPKAGAEVLLQHRMHYRAAADVANTDTQNLLHPADASHVLQVAGSDGAGGRDRTAMSSQLDRRLLRSGGSIGQPPSARSLR